MNIKTLLKQRRSTRHYDPNHHISQDEVLDILRTATLSPSGNNSQPWRFVVLTEQTLKQALLPIAYHQQQIISASAVILILADRQAYLADNLTKIHEEEYQDGCFDADVRDFLTGAAIDFYKNFDDTQLVKFLGLDIGMVAMNIMLVALDKGYQSVPMSGYDRQALRQHFKLDDRYLDMMMIALGKGVAQGHRTLRHDIHDVVRFDCVF